MRVSLLYYGDPEVELIVDFPKTSQHPLSADLVAATRFGFDAVLHRVGSDVTTFPDKFARYIFEECQKNEAVGLLMVILRKKFPDDGEISLIYQPIDVGLTLTSHMAKKQAELAKAEMAKQAELLSSVKKEGSP